ncbi:MAG TPA: hypothetical protein PLC79_00885 [Phycisphaerae bacterium]|nr:hypothetical protein [Phycisphaerae bacterium]
MDRRTRNRICIWVIFLGLVNFAAYAILYAELGGDASNGYIGTDPDGGRAYYVAGHFIHGREGRYSRVAPWVWIYSYVHSITIWPTEAAVLVCLLILGRPHIIATMKEDGLMQGSTFVAVCSTIVILLASALTIWFVIRFISQLTAAGG